MLCRNGKEWSPEMKNVESKILTHVCLVWPAHTESLTELS